MKRLIFLLLIISVQSLSCSAQTKGFAKNEMRAAANVFLLSLTPAQTKLAQFTFHDEERFKWNYVPVKRAGIPIKELSAEQQEGAMKLLRTALSDTGFAKTKAVIELENVLKIVENQGVDSDYRDAGKYYFSIFGNPTSDSIWGWRLEGHHVSFNFSSDITGLVSGTPGFLGANPAVVLSGTKKGTEVLKDETKFGFALLHSLTDSQKGKAIISTNAPSEIITRASRKAMIENVQGILYSELTTVQQKLMLQLLRLYIHRYKEPFASKMMKDIEDAGFNNLRFAWAGAQQPGVGNPHYYRIQSPAIIIEYDNTQNNANHVHTVVRDLKNDFGGDQLLKHYQHTKH
jgi:hypothetical protein